MSEKHLQRVRRICVALLRLQEKLSHGEPTFFVRKKVFAACSFNHHNVRTRRGSGAGAARHSGDLIEGAPDKFYRPPYVGGAGWIGIELDRVSDEELAFHIREAWRLIASEKLQTVVESDSGRT